MIHVAKRKALLKTLKTATRKAAKNNVWYLMLDHTELSHLTKAVEEYEKKLTPVKKPTTPPTKRRKRRWWKKPEGVE